jgi:hypothetical protein
MGWGEIEEAAADSVAQQREESSLQERESIDGSSSEFSEEELAEFLDAEWHPIEADPKFKEELREELWRLVQRQLRSQAPANSACSDVDRPSRGLGLRGRAAGRGGPGPARGGGDPLRSAGRRVGSRAEPPRSG